MTSAQSAAQPCVESAAQTAAELAAQSSVEPAVELRSVRKEYDAFRALDDLDLVVPHGSFFCLLGASGSGKSTALRLVAGLEQVTRGEVRIAGRDVTSVPPHLRPVNTVFQSYALFPRMDLLDNVAYGLRAKRVAKAEVARRVGVALDMVRMREQRHKRASELSGGQQQRIALARALVNEPEVLLLDEPLGALDLQLRRDMQEELVRLHQRTATTFVHVTHDQEEAFACASHVGVMAAGRLVQVGSPEQLYRRPRTAFVAGFVGSANLLPVEVVGSDRPDDPAAWHPTYAVRGPLGTARAGAADRLTIGGRALMVVRPEDVDLREVDHQTSDDWVQGRLVSRTATGSTTRFVVEVAGSTLIAEALSSPSTSLAAGPGAAVQVRVTREAGWLVPDEGA